MNLYKKTLFTILLLLFLVNLRSAVVYIDGWAAGKIISIKNNDAYLLTESSGKKKDQNILISFNLSDKIIKWGTPISGYLNTFVQITNDRLVTIESDTVISRNPQNGNIIWKIDLRTISTGSQDVTPNEYKPHISYVWKKVYNRCIREPSKAKWFNYTPFIPDVNNVFLFRTARYHYDGLIPFEKDWVQIDLRSGDVIGKGCYALRGFSKNMAFITDYRDIFSLNRDILIKKEKIIEWYSIPGLKLVSKFKLEENDDFENLYGEFLFSEGDNDLLVAYLTGRIFQTVMKKRKNKQTVYFKFFDFKTGIKRASLKRKLTYYKKKRKTNSDT